MTKKEIIAALKAAHREHPNAPTCDVEFWVGKNDEQEMHWAPVPLAGEVTPLVAYILSNGQCHALAAALHETTGWPIVGCWCGDGLSRQTSHFAVLAPSLCTADIDGLRAVDYNLRKARPETIVSGRVRGFLRPAMPFARYFAPLIMPEILAQNESVMERRGRPAWTFGGSAAMRER